MKKRRTLIVAMLLVVAVALGIGYANLNRELSFNGTANLRKNQSNFKINITDATPEDTTLGSCAVVSDVSASFNVTGLDEIGEKTSFTFTVTNKTTDVYAKLESTDFSKGNVYIGEGTSTAGVYDDYFTIEHKVYKVAADGTYTVEWDKANDILYPSIDGITANSNIAKVVVTVTLKKTIQEDIITMSGSTVMVDWISTPAPVAP